VSYIDAGYAIALTVLAAYATNLWFRRRRLEQAVRQMHEQSDGARP
jgi:hypothetical protein